MTRQEYMQQLAALLAAMPEAERRDALDSVSYTHLTLPTKA